MVQLTYMSLDMISWIVRHMAKSCSYCRFLA